VPVVEAMIALVLADHLLRQALLKTKTGSAGLRSERKLIDEMISLLSIEKKDIDRRLRR
jgi:hypothetical protein